MANDLVERLREARVFTYDQFTEKGAKHYNALLDEAAARITELEAALEETEAKLDYARDVVKSQSKFMTQDASGTYRGITGTF